MGAKTGITWTDSTWNPVTGCTPVSPGCDNCYAARYAKRGMGDFGTKYKPLTGEELGTRQFSEIYLHPDRLDIPLHWRRPRKIFVCSMGDLFHESVPDEFIARVFNIMRSATNHTFQVLTKRPSRMLQWFSKCGNGGKLGWITHNNTEPEKAYRGTGIIVGATNNWPLKNVWIGVTAENQAMADERIPLLLQTPATVRFVSCEPMLGPITIDWVGGFTPDVAFQRPPLLDLVIVGGETGPGARPMHPDWVRSLRDQCLAAGVPFHFKQWGEWAPDCLCGSAEAHRAIERPYPGRTGVMFMCGKNAAGRLLDGNEWLQFPEPKQQEIDRQC